MKLFVSRRNQLNFVVSLFLMLDFQFSSVYGFAISCTKATKKSNYLNSHGEEPKRSYQAYKEWAPLVK